MSSALGQNSRHKFMTRIEPKIILDLVEIVYVGTMDDQRWFETIELSGIDEPTEEAAQDEPVEELTLDEPAEEPPLEPTEESAEEEDAGIYGHVRADGGRLYKAGTGRREIDEMGRLLSRYAASQMYTLRQDAAFMREITRGSRFAGDLIMDLEP